MKYALSIFLVLIFTFQLVQCQVTDTLTQKSQQEMYDFHIQKHKKLKKTGWILLGAGLVTVGGGYAIAATSDGLFGSGDGFEAGSILIMTGTLSMAASIPVFIISGSNKRKAEAILETGNIGFGSIPFDNQRYVSVGLRIDF